jgi:formamidopyrimidine-DNA glycosylase
MPEICEVALTAEILNGRLQKDYLKDIIILSGRYTKSQPEGYSKFAKMLKENPFKIMDINSRGKFMWFELVDKQGREVFIWNTFGLTGMWGFELKKNSRLQFITKKENFFYTDDRNFGTVKFDFDRQNLVKKLKTLPIDFLKDDITEKDFRNRLSELKKPSDMIVEVLMNQKKLGSGLGNYLVPEILYRAKISPYQQIGNMSSEQIHALFTNIQKVVKSCYISNKTGYMKYLEQYLPNLKRRNYLPSVKISKTPFEYSVYMQDKDPYGNKVVGDKIIKDRTTYWVPTVQKIIKKKKTLVV